MMTELTDAELLAFQGDLDHIETGNKPRARIFLRMPAEGIIVARILPPREGFIKPYSYSRLHNVNGRNIHCIRQYDEVDKKWRGECPLCDLYSDVWNSHKEAKTEAEAEQIKNLARDLKPYERWYYNVIVRRYYDPDKKEEIINAGPLVAPFGVQLQEKTMRAVLGYKKFNKPSLGRVWDTMHGRDFRIIKEKKGTSQWGTYEESTFDEVSPLGTQEEIEQWLAARHDLEAIRNDRLFSYEDLERQVRIYRGIEEDTETSFNSRSFTEQPKTNGSGSVSVSVPSLPSKEVVRAETKEEALEVPTTKDSSVSEGEFFKDFDSNNVEEDYLKDLDKVIDEMK